jgi:hypothetical protein
MCKALRNRSVSAKTLFVESPVSGHGFSRAGRVEQKMGFQPLTDFAGAKARVLVAIFRHD